MQSTNFKTQARDLRIGADKLLQPSVLIVFGIIGLLLGKVIADAGILAAIGLIGFPAMLFFAALFGVVSVVTGYLIALWLDVSLTGMMVTVAGVIFGKIDGELTRIIPPASAQHGSLASQSRTSIQRGICSFLLKSTFGNGTFAPTISVSW